MDLQQLEIVAPAAFSNNPAPHTSDRYVHVRTADIVEKMMDAGFVITNATQQKTQKRTAGKESFQKHRITMRMPWDNGSSRALGQVFPTVDIVNSGDWSSKLLMAVGLYRLICTNGMIAPFGSQNEAISVRHDRVNEDTMSAMTRAIDMAPGLVSFAENAVNRQLDDYEIHDFGRAAARLRFSVPDEDTPHQSMIDGLLQARRSFDSKNDLWSVFNRVQENGTRGGFKVPDANGRMRQVKARRAIVADVNWNQGLWGLTEERLN